jgi:large subunit ribosomal protein L40e
VVSEGYLVEEAGLILPALGKRQIFNPREVLADWVVGTMPLTDLVKKRIAQEHRLFMKICRDCGARNSSQATKCRKCRGKNLRWKKRELGAK